MKKGALISGILLLALGILVAQTPDWCWAQSFGSAGADFGRAVCRDDAGNTYVTGYFSETITFGTQTLMSSGDTDIFVSKLDPDGNVVWTAQAGGTQEDQGCGINIDSNGDVYITGRFMDTVIFGTNQISSNGDADMYLAKLDSDGNWLWVRQGGGTGFDWATYTIGIDQNDNIIITGGFRNSATFGTTTFTTSDGHDDIFVASFDTEGSWQWVTQAGGNGWDYGCAIATLDDGTTFVTGGFTEDSTFGTTTLSTFTTPDIYVAKLDTNGAWQWAVQAGDNTYFPDFGQAIGVDQAGNAYIGGYFMGTAEFGTIMLTSPGNPNSDIFVAKIDGTGTWQWATMAGGNSDDMIDAVAVDAAGNTYTTGCFSGTAMFGSESLTSAGGHDIFGAVIDTDGIWQLALRAGGSAEDNGLGIGLDNYANAYITGYIESTAEIGSQTLVSNGERDIFVAKLGLDVTFNSPDNVLATVQNYNDVLITWDIPSDALAFAKGKSYENTSNFPANKNTRALAGYNVYRDGVMIGEILDLAIVEYLDESLDAGDYSYYVIATYTDPVGESDPSVSASAEVILTAPAGVSGSSNWPDISLSWTALDNFRAVESYSIYRDDVQVGTSVSCSFIDTNVPAGTYVYNVSALFSGNWEGLMSEDSDPIVHGTVAGPAQNPVVTSLEGNYPNPFNPSTTITFALQKEQEVSLAVYDSKGCKIRTLVNAQLQAGYHDIQWNGKDNKGKTVSSGIYFYRMETETSVDTKKMILMK